MGTLGTILIAVGAIGAFVFQVMILIHAFKKSVGWGLACLFIPFVILVYVAQNWAETKTPFLRWLICFVVILAGVGLTAMGVASQVGTEMMQGT